MTSTAAIEWMPYTEMTDGHRFFPLSKRNDDGPDSWFTDKALPMIAIADASGEEPQDTDDGVLWLDFARSLMAGSVTNEPPTIPVLTDDGTEKRIITDDPTIMMLGHKYSWDINAHGILFTVRRVA